jgi:radical SAM superfamily enzyme YgiQ (UPF0313 family)
MYKMKNILIISFDIINDGECSVSYSIASLLASLKSNETENLNRARLFQNSKSLVKMNRVLQEALVHWSFNVTEKNFKKDLYDKLKSVDINKFERIAISVFVWSESIVRKLLKHKDFINYKGIIILGGRQIIGEEKELEKDYPQCKIFITGYGEYRIKEAMLKDADKPIVLHGNAQDLNFPSPYLAGELDVQNNQKMVRMETKRGCPYPCAFCAHKDLNATSVHDFPFDRITAELNLFQQKRVGKINIIDPIFNTGDKYLDILAYIYNNKITSKISIQARFEKIKGEKGKKFIDMCGKLNIVLEFGVQSLVERECKNIDRGNDIKNIERVIKILNKKKIDYEVSLIYGLPEQSLETFRETIEHLRLLKCKKIKAYPLMLLKGTKLYQDKEKWNLREKVIKNIPLVVESNSFSETEWKQMKKMAECL